MKINLNPKSWSVVFASCFLFANAMADWSSAADPTTPSPQIAKRLELNAKPTSPDVELVDVNQFRLKAMVLRDSNNGTALISVENSHAFVLRLRRSELRSARTRFTIRGLHFVVKDFSRSAILLHRVDTNEQFIVH
ncbi:hypothetical protein ACFL2H_08080 [Planctomycetota bacterium]